jgi:hypothetical protein
LVYLSFDDEVVLGAAGDDPAGFVDDLPVRVILNEVQRVPSLTAGGFILTGSANVLLVSRLADSLAGRMEILRLHPLAQSELEHERPNFFDAPFAGGFKTRRVPRLRGELADRIAAGGYPDAQTARLQNITDLSGPFSAQPLHHP